MAKNKNPALRANAVRTTLSFGTIRRLALASQPLALDASAWHRGRQSSRIAAPAGVLAAPNPSFAKDITALEECASVRDIRAGAIMARVKRRNALAESYSRQLIQSPAPQILSRARNATNTSLREGYIRDEKDRIVPNLANVLIALRTAPDLADAFAYDEMERAPVLMTELPLAPNGQSAGDDQYPRPVRDADVSQLQEVLQHRDLPRVGKDTAARELRVPAIHKPALAIFFNVARRQPCARKGGRRVAGIGGIARRPNRDGRSQQRSRLNIQLLGPENAPCPSYMLADW
jgi:hypothetical protein